MRSVLAAGDVIWSGFTSRCLSDGRTAGGPAPNQLHWFCGPTWQTSLWAKIQEHNLTDQQQQSEQRVCSGYIPPAQVKKNTPKTKKADDVAGPLLIPGAPKVTQETKNVART